MTTQEKQSPIAFGEIALVALVGYGLAVGSQKIPALNDNKILTRTLLYVLGYYVATRRPVSGYALTSKA